MGADERAGWQAVKDRTLAYWKDESNFPKINNGKRLTRNSRATRIGVVMGLMYLFSK